MNEKIVVDFHKTCGKVRPALYGSGLHPQIADRHLWDSFGEFKKLRFHSVRNHDWALVNAGQRMIDVHFVFPLQHLDPSDERNYYFGPSDEVIRLCYEAGSKVFYRLGTSIEHTEGVHFNANPPEDFDHFAEVCAGIVRHYTRGWNHGFTYDMPYWEIWNEPEGKCNMWTGDREQFARMFAITLKRLKSEFPELKFGGPALCYWNVQWIDAIKAECDRLNVKPDFISFHMYVNDLKYPEQLAREPKRYMRELGWGDVETCINEWHFIRAWNGVHSNVTPALHRRSMYGKDGLHGINSAAFNIATYCIWQAGDVDSAFYYGCGFSSWGLLRPDLTVSKNYFSMVMMRDFVWNYQNLVDVKGGTSTQRMQAAVSEDGQKGAVLISDFCGSDMTISLEICGFENPSRMTCIVLDEARDNQDVPIQKNDDGSILLTKSEPGSAVFMILLEK